MKNILVVDIGGTSIKVFPVGRRAAVRIPSGPRLTPARMVRLVREVVPESQYAAVSIGYPGPVTNGRPAKEPKHLGRGWTRFDFQRAFGRPVKVVNDAAMQAIGSYKRGRMLFLGLGTGLGTTLIADGVVMPMELAHLPFGGRGTYEEYLGKPALKRFGKRKWRRRVADVTRRLKEALEVDEVVLGGGNAKHLRSVPRGARLGSNRLALAGGLRLWSNRASMFARHKTCC
jgi:predicted NBD/HSP70 family sugar kinase